MQKYDKAIVVLTQEMFLRRDGKWRSDLYAHLNLSAAAKQMLDSKRRGEKPVLIIAGGHTHGGGNPDLASTLEGELMRRYSLFEKDVIREGQSLDTSENAEFSKRILKEHGLESRFELIANDFHLRRAMRCFEYYGLHPHGIASEDILLKEPGMRNKVKKMMGSWDYFKKRVKNTLYLALFDVFGPNLFRKRAHYKVDHYGHL